MSNLSASSLRTVRMEDIPPEMQDLAAALGIESFLRLLQMCGGQNLYIPKIESIERDGRDREIRSRFNGGNYRSLAAQFRLSERQIRKIINGCRG